MFTKNSAWPSEYQEIGLLFGNGETKTVVPPIIGNYIVDSPTGYSGRIVFSSSRPEFGFNDARRVKFLHCR